MIRRIVMGVLLGVLSLDAHEAVHAFLAPLTREWEAHPELPTLRIGMGTVVILKKNGRSIRYSGQIEELNDRGRLSYRLELHSGFVAESGRWHREGRKGVKVVFSGKLMPEKTVVLAQPPKSTADELATSCSAGAPFVAAEKIVCGSVVLKRIKVVSIPTRLETLPQ